MHDFRNSGASFETGGKNVSAYVGFDENTLVSHADHFSGVNVWAANEEKLAAGSAVTSSILNPDSQLKEGFNSAIQLIKANARGYRNFTN